MQYMLLIYGEERAAENMPREQMTSVVNAYMAYSQALGEAKVLVGSNRLRPTSAATAVRYRRAAQGAGWPVRRDQGTARRLLLDRRARPRRCAVLGETLPRVALWHRRGAAGLGDVRDAAAAVRRLKAPGMTTCLEPIFSHDGASGEALPHPS